MSIDKVICVGKNYLEHAKELGDAIPDESEMGLGVVESFRFIVLMRGYG